ncbi:two-component system regulatory protein YycI [Agrilactobacillus fermenti]|uniref:two-component system regulatory protein YycI n=1 Tax=Agrilactobacillus fermenti TaxID=2586909 RepID=UPI001E33B3EF|nr:two-component system regulatory protein YycI [Agrilactobacillus fermenti]MCD2255616.1 two-component system regulatory protein YycI [Agrilactobacillus fermenti]
MDFKRLEMIFVAVFIALDIFLFVSYRQNQNVYSSTNSSQTPTQLVRQDMKDDNITVGQLSNKTQDGYYLASRANTKLSERANRLTGQQISFDQDDELTSRFYQPVNYRKGHAVTTAENLLKERSKVLFGREYTYSDELSSNSHLVFVQSHNNIPVYDSKAYLTFELDDGAITGYTQRYIDDFIVLREKNTVISAKEAVTNLYTDSEIPTNSTVVWQRLAYYGFVDAKGSTIYIPTWYIGIKDNSTKNISTKQINGFTGALIKNKSAESAVINSN